MRGGGRSFSGLRGNISTDFDGGISDRGYFGGKAARRGFDAGTPYQYGYPTTEEHEHVHPMYHTVYLDDKGESPSVSNPQTKTEDGV